MGELQNPFSSTPIRTLTLAVMTMLNCHITKATLANFSDSSAWTPYVYGSGVQLNNVNGGGGLQVDFAAGAQPVDQNGMWAGYISTFSLQGDFVIQMNYTLNTWPPDPNGVRLAITLAPWVGMERESTFYTSGNAYCLQTYGGLTYVPTTALSGMLQMARVGGTLTGSYWDPISASWVVVGSASGYSQDFSVYAVSWTDTATFGHQAVEVTLNDLEITGTAIPGTGIVPPPINPAGTPVPEPTTMIAGALMLLPFGASALRSLRKRQLA
jgi:hypothetical protein